MENKEKKNVEVIFEGHIEKIFGKDCLKDIEPLYNKVIENRDNNVKCGEYGDDPATIELILYLRHKMRENKLISSEPISNYLKAIPITIENFTKFLEKDGKERSWLTEEYKKRFPCSYESEPESHKKPYTNDGWNYFEYLNQNNQNYDYDIEWFYVEKNEVGHIYYNELDHYLTYLLGAIRRGIPEKIKQGKNIKKDLEKID
ncbi:hypothetical protein B7721_06955 [Streptococcus oralis subsp. oralis]|jgi:hypothetical protein|uniref:Uncharacterized protein n=1 Tax=Streptococcus oralis subsp. oralis TaxID=1891914 RepID=A0A1X1H5D8_STROR|nr:hypothetical protein [Streptococcus oralis]ORO54288.1 hypothetical protein B7721_06955 [Streptococcus oralis subsp. oralis]